jgi:4'-phosphopantetheinyl transferase
MITLFHSSTNWIKDDEIEAYLPVIPRRLTNDIVKYRRAADRKSALLARLMLRNCLASDGKISLLEAWERDLYQKPFIPGWDFFNISHSGQLVVVARSDNPVGVDVEQITSIDYNEIGQNFHPAEHTYILSAENPQTAFFDIWTKKEAFLKAVGIGLSDNLSKVNCLYGEVSYNDTCWYFHELFLYPGYAASICSLKKKEQIIITEFIPTGTAIAPGQ